MAGSQKKSNATSIGSESRRFRLTGELIYPGRTPGALGINDAADPTRPSLLADTPGSLGLSDHAAPTRFSLAGMQTYHEWIKEVRNHSPYSALHGQLFPAGSKEQVMLAAADFVARRECPGGKPPLFPYIPSSTSGVTIGVGYDLSQHTEIEFKKTWAALERKERMIPKAVTLGDFNLETNIPVPARGLHYSLPETLFTPLERLARCAGLSAKKSVDYLEEVSMIYIPEELSIQVFRESLMPKYYRAALKAYPGMDELPTGVQVALIDLVFNRGDTPKDSAVGNDLFNRGWEQRELVTAVFLKDIDWIYWYFNSMQRIWPGNKDGHPGLRRRRELECKLIEPYVFSKRMSFDTEALESHDDEITEQAPD